MSTPQTRANLKKTDKTVSEKKTPEKIPEKNKKKTCSR